MPQTRQDTSAVRRSWYQSEAASFLDHYSPEIVQRRFTNLDPHFYRQETTLDKIAQRSRRKRRPWNPLFDYVDSHWNAIGPLLPITASLLEISLLLFLFSLYYTLPADPRTGERPPRIADLYSIFPFISCIGSQRLPVYQGLTMCVVLINFISTSIGFYRGRDDGIGWQSRRTNWLVSVVSGGLAIWVVFAAANPDTHLHLTVTAAKALSVFCIKTSSWITDHLQRRRYPGLWQTGVVKFLVWWKAVTLIVALPTATMMEVAIFGCHSASVDEIQTPGAKCYRIMAMGAPAEWVYALTTISWSLTIAFDIYILPIVGEVKSRQDGAEMQLFGPDPYSPYPQLNSPRGKYGRDSGERSRPIDGSRQQKKGYQCLDSPTWGAITTDSDEDSGTEQDLGMVARIRDVV
ncbi:hypothetical protein LTR99_008532 [Exophiala xenobiotica]|uniref:Integral membrane protein n=1 Tax=Vermiconidia calcicola TaxID=1690605 RepID=A0AAV9Q0Y1_9PEZI|nr:hypothetical protein LTR99_008532 [Exophiala xenobiotica]KAK5428679.1 hypothetical protein LTR34_007845 [Exophiala xenobiotica]KAK5532922.1 hypothetical protein LTR25_007626 [Vermiconidia calcicola]KAK5546652.1 hypothetical protein LTR23_003399 [Chaetothyriales sp. CCFEE 6169]